MEPDDDTKASYEVPSEPIAIKKYSMGFTVSGPKGLVSMIEVLQRDFNKAMSDRIDLLLSGGDGSYKSRPITPPTRRQRLRTWLAERLLNLVYKLDSDVVPWD
jgi:hypothetical protein